MLKKRWLAVVAICLSIFLILALIKFFQIRAAIAFGESFPEPSETVEFQSIAYSTWQPKVTVSGEIRAPREVELRNEVAGMIAKIGFASGASLKKGNLLVQLDIAEEQAKLSALKPQIQLAKQDFERLSGIKNKQAISQQLIDQARSQLGVVRGQAASINESISNKTIIAPFDAISGLHDFEVGEYIAAETLIARLVGNTEVLWVDFKLPQQHAKIVVGENITVTAPELFAGQRSGQVSVIEPAFSRDTRSLGVRAVIANADKAITPGYFVTVSAPTGLEQTVIRLPSTAVRFNSFGSYVFLLEQNLAQWRAKKKPVTVLAKDQYQTVLKADLLEGALVATIGAYKLREGLLVNLSDDNKVSHETQKADQKSTVNNQSIAIETVSQNSPKEPNSPNPSIEQVSDFFSSESKLQPVIKQTPTITEANTSD
ncbi:MAG: membrane fusion protein (multidrug efflux system) [Arenicella sp.]|jgi:membrane fusion protein (multidrug efflux system)